jgi:hypothetical protein
MLSTSYILGSITINTIFESNINGGIVYIIGIKFIYIITNIECMNELIKAGKIEKNFLNKILDNNAILVPIVILLPLILGLGYTVYGQGKGYRGFYYASNELNALLIILYIFLLEKLYNKYDLRTLLKTIAIFICCILIESKSSLVICCLALSVYLFKIVKEQRINRNFIILSMSIFVLIANKKILSVWESFKERQQYFFYNSNDFISYFTSRRNLFVKEAFTNLGNSKISFIQVIIGNGGNEYYLTEMDFFDMFFFFGLIGIIFWSYYLLKLIVRVYLKDKKLIDIFAILLVILFSFFTGHTIFSGVAGLYFAIFCCYKMNSENFLIESNEYYLNGRM